MKDANGLYYYPFPQNKRVRMYVKKENKTIYFRLWNAEDEKLWERFKELINLDINTEILDLIKKKTEKEKKNEK